MHQTVRMAKWLCTCGNLMRSSGAMPNPQEWHLLPDTILMNLSDEVRIDDVTSQFTFAYRCEDCDRLHVFWHDLGKDPTIYAPETG